MCIADGVDYFTPVQNGNSRGSTEGVSAFQNLSLRFGRYNPDQIEHWLGSYTYVLRDYQIGCSR